MGIGVRDVDANSEVQDLLEYGYFDEEIDYYGCVYVQKGRIHYRINEQEAMIWRFVQQAAAMDLYPTMPDRLYQRIRIPTGKRENAKAQICQAFVKQLKEDYPPRFFELLAPLAKKMPNNAAVGLLQAWRRYLTACFSEEAMQLFNGALQMAYEAKLLTEDIYETMNRWQSDRFLQIEQQNRHSGAYERTFSGFAYLTEKGWQYFYDANELVVYRKRWRLEQAGIWTTPIFRQRYYLDILRTGDLSRLEKEFEQTLRLWMDEKYLSAILQMRTMPSAIEKTLYEKQTEAIERLQKPKAYLAFQHWALMWNCWTR